MANANYSADGSTSLIKSTRSKYCFALREQYVEVLDVLDRTLHVGDMVFVSISSNCRSLDYGKIVKIDIKESKVLVDWQYSPVQTWSWSSGNQKRKKTWHYSYLCARAC